MLFRAREIREGTNPDELRRQLNEALKLIERDLSTALGRPRVSEVITAATYAPSFGEVARVAPPSTGLALQLPEPNLARLGERVNVVQVAASGAMTVEVVNGTINGATTLAYLAGVGTVEFILTPEGWYGWSVSLVASFPLTGLAAQAANTIVANATASSAPPTAVAVSADSLLARVGGNLVSHPWSTVAGAGLTYSAGALAVGAGTGITVNANDVAVAIPLTDGDKGDITVATSGTAWTIDANAVTNAKLAQMAARRIKGREDGVSTGDAQDLTGAEVGEILRFVSTISDATSTGTVTTYALTEGANIVRFLVGVGAAITLRGATIPAEEGQFIIWENNDGTGSAVTFNHEDGSAAAAGNRFRCPGAANYALTAGHRLITCYINTRHRIIATA
jgi:hypothetical protein